MYPQILVRRPEFITVSDDEKHLLYFHCDPDSHSGWSHESVELSTLAPNFPPVEYTVDRLWAFWEKDRLVVFCSDGQGSIYAYESPCQESSNTCVQGWGSSSLFGGSGAVQVDHLELYRDPGGQHYILVRMPSLGPSEVGMAVYTSDATGQWVGYIILWEAEAASDPVFKIAGGDAQNGMQILRFDGEKSSYRTAKLASGKIDWVEPEWQPLDNVPGETALGSVQLIAAKDYNDYLKLDGSGELHYVSDWCGQYPTSTRLTSGEGQPQGVSQYTVGADDQGNYRIFVLDKENQELWILRQNGYDKAGHPVFDSDSWIRLGGTYQLIQSPALMTEYGELFAITFEPEILHMRQDGGNNVWRQSPIHTPIVTANASPSAATTYTTELNFTTEQGVPAAGALVDIYVSRSVAMNVNGLTYHAGAKYPLSVPTDTMGRLTLSTVADKLSAANLLVHVRDFMADGEAIALNPALSTHRRLSGQDNNFPVTGAALQEKGLIDKKFSSDDADQVAACIMKVGSLMTPTQAPANTTKLQQWLAAGQSLAGFTYVANVQDSYLHPVNSVNAESWCLDFSNPQAIKFQVYETSPRALESFFSFKGLWGDIAHFVKHVVDDVKKIEATVVNDITKLVVTLGDDVACFVIDTVEKAGEILGAIFHKIAEYGKKFADVMKDVIDWIRDLFAWKDIVRTGRVIYHYIDQSLSNLTGSVEDWRTLLDDKFDDFKKNIITSFDSWEATFGTQSFNDFLGGSQTITESTTGQSPTWPGMRSAYASHAVQCNYVQTRIQRHSEGGGKANFDWAAQGEDSMEALFSVVQKCFPQKSMERPCQDMIDWSKKVTDVKTFLEMSVCDVLEVFRDFVLLVLDGIQEVLDALLKLTGKAIFAFRSAMETKIDIPVISWLFGSDSLNWLHLFSYALAAPVTILYKLVYGHGHEAPFATDQEVDAIVSKPIPWPQVEGARNDAAQRAVLYEDNLFSPELRGIVAGISIFVYWIYDSLLDGFNMDGLEPGRKLPLITLLSELSAWIFGAPYELFASANRSEADKLVLAFWGVSGAPALSDLFAYYAKGLARFFKTEAGIWVGAWWDGLMGAALLGLGVTAAVYMDKDPKYNKAAIAYSILAPFPQLGKPVSPAVNKAKQDLPESAPVYLLLFGLVELLDFVNVGAGVALIASVV